MLKTRILLFLSFFSINFLSLNGEPRKPFPDKTFYWVEWHPDHNGVFSNLFRAKEWIYCIKTTHRMALYLNMAGQWGATSNLWNDLFVDASDLRISTKPPRCSIGLSTHHLPIGMGQHFFNFNRYLGTGIKNFDETLYLYQYLSTYKDPNFFLFRLRVNKIIKTYLKLQPKLAEKVSFYTEKLEEKRKEGKKILGVQFRFSNFYLHSDEINYLDQIKIEIDELMNRLGPSRTVLFLATLIEPLKQYLEERYEAVTQDIPRTHDAVFGDWTTIHHLEPHLIPEQAIIDTWTLANCDEVWSGASNMILFACCLNPSLDVHFFPCIQNCQGA